MTPEPELQGEETHRAEQKVAEEAQPTEEVQRVEAARRAAIVPVTPKSWPAGTLQRWREYDAGEGESSDDAGAVQEEHVIEFARDADWFQDFQRSDGTSGTHGDKAAAALKVKHLAYFLEHHLGENTIEALRHDILDSTFQAKAARLADKKLARKWQAVTIADYILFLATKIRGKKLGKTPPVEILHLTSGERKALYREEWNKNPLQLVCRMWSLFTKTIDFYHIFNPPASATDEEKATMEGWRRYLLLCYLWAIDDAVWIRIRDTSKDSSKPNWASNWKNMMRVKGFSKPPSTREVPVRGGK